VAAVLEALASRLPQWLLPSLVVAVAGIAVWAQNIQAQFGVIDTRLATLTQTAINNAEVARRLEDDVERTIDAFRTDVIQSLANMRGAVANMEASLRTDLRGKVDIATRDDWLRSAEQRMSFHEQRIDELIKHLEATDARLERLRDEQTPDRPGPR
jgi:flagellar biosynthesis GTPase FlhF